MDHVEEIRTAFILAHLNRQGACKHCIGIIFQDSWIVEVLANRDRALQEEVLKVSPAELEAKTIEGRIPDVHLEVIISSEITFRLIIKVGGGKLIQLQENDPFGRRPLRTVETASNDIDHTTAHRNIFI